MVKKMNANIEYARNEIQRINESIIDLTEKENQLVSEGGYLQWLEGMCRWGESNKKGKQISMIIINRSFELIIQEDIIKMRVKEHNELSTELSRIEKNIHDLS